MTESNFSPNKYYAKVPRKILARSAPGKKSVLKCWSRIFCTKTLPTIPSNNCYNKLTDMKFSSNKYRKGMLPKTPLLIAFDRKIYRNARQKIPSETLPKTPPTIKYCFEMLVINFLYEKLPKKPTTLLFQKRQCQSFCRKVPFKAAVQNTGKKSLPGEDCFEMLVMNFLYEMLSTTPLKS